jgi:rhomboid protease GluP
MQTGEPAALPEQTFAVKYQAFGSVEPNLDFRGKGLLVIRPTGPSYEFSGKERALFAFGRKTAMEFRADEIWDVAVVGSAVQFHTHRGRAGAKGKPFRFYCRDDADVATVGALFPERKEADFVEAQDFTAKLRAMPGDARSWNSVTNLLIAANLLVFVVMAAFLGAGWLEVKDLLPYMRWGANNGAATTGREWWRLVTSMFMHYGVFHVVLNMWALFQMGHLVEKLLGRWSYALAYFGSGITGGLGSIIWHGDKIWSAGASGAIFGVYGALFGYMLREKHTIPRGVFQPMFKSTIAFAGYNLVYGMANPGIDNAAHIGGLLGGFVIGWVVAVPIEPQLRAALMPARLRLGVLVAAVLIGVGIALTPRFGYRMADEIAWAAAIKGQPEKEGVLLKRFQEALDKARFARTGEGAADLVRDEMIPFYQHWREQVGALQAEPGSLAGRRRKQFGQILEMMVVNYQKLLAGLRIKDPAALDNFMREQKQIQGELTKLPKSP